MRKRIGAACEHFIDVREKNDGAIARAVRDSEIDIAVDLNGLTLGARPGILAHRPARVRALHGSLYESHSNSAFSARSTAAGCRCRVSVTPSPRRTT